MTTTETRQAATSPTDDSAAYDIEGMTRTLYSDGIVGLKGAFSREWVTQLREDVEAAFHEAHARPNGAVGRGPERFYVEIHPEQIRGFVDLATHPWVRAMSEAVLGPDYEITELGFDTPFQNAMNQPWHRDFPAPEATTKDGKLITLAFNLTTVDVTEDMGPFQIAPGTQWEDGSGFKHGMFPPKSEWPRYERLGQLKRPQMGDISCRTALAIHRGTKHDSPTSRPVLVLGVDAPGGGNAERHDMAITKGFAETLPRDLRRHLLCPVVDELTPIEQKHTIEGLEMGAE